jgi:ElaB/YqjD/DUF883 family membrane-anchored ribosome-binding protein
MFATLMRLVGVDLQHQLARLKSQANELKASAISEVKHQAIDTGITIGLVLSGLVLTLLTIVTGLIALYLWVEPQQGPYVALGLVGGTTAIVAIALFVVAATRGRRKASAQPARSASFAAGRATLATASPTRDLTHRLTQRTAEATDDALESAAEFVRKSPRETILAALAVSVIVGVVIGRRR